MSFPYIGGMKVFLTQLFQTLWWVKGFALLWFLSAGPPCRANEAPPAPSPGGPPGAKPHFIEQAMPFVFIFLLFYLLLIRPATKRHKKHQDFITQLKKGDQVVTASGLFGRVNDLTPTVVTLEIANNTRVKILRSQISSYAPQSNSKTPS